MLDTIKKIRDVASFLNDSSENETLDIMQEALEKKEYLISFMGQFSAGKSKLINNILQKDILPVHITETTAVITLIRYGESEYAEVTYKDGIEKQISVAESQQLWQSGAGEEITKIEAITIYLPNPLLKDGLIIVDTPGINTIINAHIQLTTELLNRSEKVVYVMGKSLTESDLKFIKKIQTCGLSTLFVRTHMDVINSAEETLKEAIAKENSALNDITKDPIFFISNESNSPLFQEINALRNYLQVTLADNVQEMLEISCKQRLAMISSKFAQELIQQKNSYQQLADGKMQEYQESKKKITDAMEQLDHQIEKRSANSQKKCQEAKEEAEELVQSVLKKTGNVIQKTLDNLSSNTTEKQIVNATEDCISEQCHKIQDIYMDCMENVIGEAQAEFKEILNKNFPNSDIDSYIPENIEETQEQLEILEEAMKKVNSFENEQQNTDAQIDALKETNAAMQEQFNAASAKRVEVENILKDYPAYEKKYKVIQEASNENEMKMRSIGNVLDFAMILIPGKAFTTVGAKALQGTAKVAAKVGVSAQKVRQIGTKARQLGKLARKANKADTILDVARVGQKVNAAATTHEARKNSPLKILDYFTLEYYFAKIGKHFDKKEITEVDREYEKDYYNKKAEIEKQVNESVQEELWQRMAMNQNMSEIRRLEMEKRLRQTRQAEADRELKKVKARIEQQKVATSRKKMCEFYIHTGIDIVNSFAEELQERMKDNFPKYVELYTASESVTIMNKLANQKQKLEALELEFGNLNSNQIHKKMQVYQEYISFLNDIMGNATEEI